MAIHRVGTNNVYFGAILKGNAENLIKTCKDAGLKNDGVKDALNIIHEACPKDNVYLYYREVHDMFDEYVGIRSGIKVVRNGKVLEKNINPNSIGAKYLLHKFAYTVRDLVSGNIKPDERIDIYN